MIWRLLRHLILTAINLAFGEYSHWLFVNEKNYLEMKRKQNGLLARHKRSPKTILQEMHHTTCGFSKWRLITLLLGNSGYSGYSCGAHASRGVWLELAGTLLLSRPGGMAINLRVNIGEWWVHKCRTNSTTSTIYVADCLQFVRITQLLNNYATLCQGQMTCITMLVTDWHKNSFELFRNFIFNDWFGVILNFTCISQSLTSFVYRLLWYPHYHRHW